MAPTGQRTFAMVPQTVSVQTLIARAEGTGIVSHPPTTTRMIKEAKKKRTAAAAPSDVELRRQRLEAERNKKERDKEKNSGKAKAAREKKAEKERAEREERKRLGLPIVEVTASQATIAGFFRGGGALERRREVGGGALERRREVGGVELVKGLEGDKENRDPEPPAKRQKVEEEGERKMQRAPSRKRVFGQNLPLQVPGGRVVEKKEEGGSVSPEKKMKRQDLKPETESPDKKTKRQSPKPETESTSPAKKRLRLSPEAKEAPSDTKAEPALPVPRTHKVEEKKSTGSIGREQKVEDRKATSAREVTPSSNTAMTTKPESKLAASSKPTPIAKSTPVPTAALANMPPPERTRSEPVNMANAPQHRRPSPPVNNTERGSSNPPTTSSTAHRSSAQAPVTGPSNHSRSVTSATYAKPSPKTDHPTVRPAVLAKVQSAASPTTTSKPPGAAILGHPSAQAPRAHSPLVPPVGRPPVISPKQHGPLGSGHPSARTTAFAQPQQKPPARPSTTLPAAPAQRPAPAHHKYQTHSRPPPISAASYGYLPAAQPRGPPKPVTPGNAFARPTRPQHTPTVPVFKYPNVSAGQTGFQTRKFLPKHASSSTPMNPRMPAAGLGAGTGPPTSTQRFLEAHADSVFPSPSQEERELQECSAAPPTRPAFIKPRPVVTSRPQPPPFKSRPPVPRFSTTPAPKPKPAPRQPPSANPVNPVRLQAVQQMDDFLPFLSTQDFAFSSQDMREVGESSDTPSKLPPKPRAEPRPSPLSNIIPSLSKVSPAPPAVAIVVKGPARTVVPQRTPVQPSNRQVLSVGNGPAKEVPPHPGPRGIPQQGPHGPPQRTPIQPANPRPDSGKPTLSPFGSCSDRPRFFNSQESVDPREFMNLVAENIKVCHEIEEMRQRQLQDQAGSNGVDRGAGDLLSQETNYGDFDVDPADLPDF